MRAATTIEASRGSAAYFSYLDDGLAAAGRSRADPDVCQGAEIQARWQSGDRDGAAALVTDDMVLATTLIGTEEMVRERLRRWRAAGVDTVRMYPAGDSPDAKLTNLARGIELAHAID